MHVIRDCRAFAKFGRCDAAVVVAKDTALADAVATRVANEVRSAEDIKDALDIASKIPGVAGAVVVFGDASGGWRAISSWRQREQTFSMVPFRSLQHRIGQTYLRR